MAVFQLNILPQWCVKIVHPARLKAKPEQKQPQVLIVWKNKPATMMDINILMYNSFKQHISFTIKRCPHTWVGHSGSRRHGCRADASLCHPAGTTQIKYPHRLCWGETQKHWSGTQLLFFFFFLFKAYIKNFKLPRSVWLHISPLFSEIRREELCPGGRGLWSGPGSSGPHLARSWARSEPDPRQSGLPCVFSWWMLSRVSALHLAGIHDALGHSSHSSQKQELEVMQ